ncbi:hypothetical protein KQI63_10190 [bacterium]|nr:hypothetical protein [bacterium]
MSITTVLLLTLVAVIGLTYIVLDGLLFRRVFHQLKWIWWFVMAIIVLIAGNRFVAITSRENLNEPALSIIPSIVLFILGGLLLAIGFMRMAPWQRADKG